MNLFEEYIIYKQMLSNPNTLQGLYGLDSKVRSLHKKLIEYIDTEFEGKLIVERLNRMFDNINVVISKKKEIDFFKDDAKDIANELYYWIILNQRVKFWLTKEEVKRPEWFNF